MLYIPRRHPSQQLMSAADMLLKELTEGHTLGVWQEDKGKVDVSHKHLIKLDSMIV